MKCGRYLSCRSTGPARDRTPTKTGNVLGNWARVRSIGYALGVAVATSIEWTEMTWNPVRGCSRISPGCQHCYAERMAHRFSGPGLPYEGLTKSVRGEPRWTGRLKLVPESLPEPLKWKRPRMVFVNSMSDLFHKNVPTSFIQETFDVMNRAYWHTFQILTKRPERCVELAREVDWTANIWQGTSVESAGYLRRVDALREVPAEVRFLSIEPLLGPLPGLDLEGIGWVIVGGESGPGARAMDPGWVREIRDRCVDRNIPFFFKQWGGVRKKTTGRELDGRTWNELPTTAVAAE